MARQARRLLLNHSRQFVPVTAVLLIVIGLLAVKLLTAYGESQLLSRSIMIGSSAAGVTTSYTVGITPQSANVIGSIQISFCANSPIETDACTAPSGFNAAQAAVSSMTGTSGFTVSSASTANVLVLSRPPLLQPAQPITITLSNIINPSGTGSYYGRIATFASGDASGNVIDYGGAALAIANTIRVSAEVPPYLVFCSAVTIPAYDCGQATGTGIDFGELSATQTRVASSQLLVATNAEGGYNVSVNGTTMTSGNNVIDALSAADVSRAGTDQFGLNLRSNAAPAVGSEPAGPGSGQPSSDYDVPNYYRFANGDVIAGSGVANDYRRYTVSYIVNVDHSQPPGVYVSTRTNTGSGNF